MPRSMKAGAFTPAIPVHEVAIEAIFTNAQ